MTRDEIIEMARASGFKFAPAQFSGVLEAEVSEFDVEAFAALVAAKEREACAQTCEGSGASIWEYHDEVVKQTARTVCSNLAKAIRARGAQ